MESKRRENGLRGKFPTKAKALQVKIVNLKWSRRRLKEHILFYNVIEVVNLINFVF